MIIQSSPVYPYKIERFFFAASSVYMLNCPHAHPSLSQANMETISSDTQKEALP